MGRGRRSGQFSKSLCTSDDLQVSGIILQLLDVVSHTSGAAGKDFCPTAEDVVIRQLEKGPVSITWTGWRPISNNEDAIDNLPTFLVSLSCPVWL